MATMLTDENLELYKTQIDEFEVQVDAWTRYLNDAEKALSNSTGALFKAKYAKGLKATINIRLVIDLLQSVQKDLKALLSVANEYYTACKSVSNS